MTEIYDQAEMHIWEFRAHWGHDGRPHFCTGTVRARNLDEAEKLAIAKTHPKAEVFVKFSAWNREG